MYRKLMTVPVGLFAAAAFVTMNRLSAGSEEILLGSWMWWTPQANSALMNFFLYSALPLLAGLALAWAAAFRPGRRYGGTLFTLKSAAAVALFALAGSLVYNAGKAAGHAAHILSLQMDREWAPVIAVGQVHALLKLIGLAAVLAAPLFWVVRGIQVRSLTRATFEAWVEVKRLAVPAAVLLVAAGLIEAWVSPVAIAWLMR